MWQRVGIICISIAFFFFCATLWWDINEAYQKTAQLMMDTNMAMRAALHQTQVADDYFTNSSGTRDEGTHYGGLFDEAPVSAALTGGTEPYVNLWNYTQNKFVNRSLLRYALGDETASKEDLMKLYLGNGTDFEVFKTNIRLGTGDVFNVEYNNWYNSTADKWFLLDQVGKRPEGYAGELYYTPLALGVTYLNPDVFKTAFETNLQMIARSAFITGTANHDLTNAHNISQMQHGTGLIHKKDYEVGRFMYGVEDPNNPDWLNNGQYEIDLSSLSYDIKYYLADMDSSATTPLQMDEVTTYLYGKTVAELRGQDTGGSAYSNVTDVHTTSGFLVAEVNISMDVYIPYSNVILRWFTAYSTNWFAGADMRTQGTITTEPTIVEYDTSDGIVNFENPRGMTDMRHSRRGGLRIDDFSVRMLFAVTR